MQDRLIRVHFNGGAMQLAHTWKHLGKSVPFLLSRGQCSTGLGQLTPLTLTRRVAGLGLSLLVWVCRCCLAAQGLHGAARLL